MKDSQMSFGFERQHLWHHFGPSLLFVGQSDTCGCRNVRVQVGWPFNGNNNQGLDAASERSENANEDILMFFFQLDLATRVQVF